LNIVSDLPPSEIPLVKALSLQRRVIDATAGDSRLEMCIQCGTCGGSCPSGPDMEHTPRQLFAMIRAGMEGEVLSSNTPFYCVSCYFCMVRCPQEVHITDIMYTLKRMAIAGNYVTTKAASDLSQSFIGDVEKYGRSFEFGLATRQFLRHHPRDVLKVAPMGLGMLTRGRMDLTPHRIEGIDELRAILRRAKALDKEEMAEVMP
jgi:heterodisulfide reductase subunit C